MKKYLSYIVLVFVVFSSCKEMEDSYKDYIVDNGRTYPQKADSLRVYPGFNKLRISWLKPKFPGVEYAMVYWNNYSDSLRVAFSESRDTLEVEIDSLEEESYSFIVQNFDQDGNASIPMEITGTPYGENYLLGLVDRQFTSAVRDDENVGIIQWNSATSELVYTEVKYQHSDGHFSIQRLDPGDEMLICEDVRPGTVFSYRSVFLPENGIDSISRSWQISDAPFLHLYSREEWVAEARNGHHDWGDGGGGQPYLVLDGNTTTGWHSNPSAPLPQCLVVDMTEILEVDRLVLTLPAPENWRYIQNVDVYLSNEPILPDVPQASWGEPLASTIYTENDRTTIALEVPDSGQYLAVVFTNSKTETYISFMELEVYGY